MRQTFKAQPMLSFVFGALLAFLSTWGLARCSGCVVMSKIEARVARHFSALAWRDSR